MMIRDYVYPGPLHLFGADGLPKQISDEEIFLNLGDYECLGCSANCPVWTEDRLPLKFCFRRSSTQWEMNHPGTTYDDFLTKARTVAWGKVAFLIGLDILKRHHGC